ncbi:ATP-binding protein, partial [Streptomyces sp.]|uniref:ATP-binding protein n=1 Tax=Streptomyces sp. TaxID=1931 RepID=UPI002F3F761A
MRTSPSPRLPRVTDRDALLTTARAALAAGDSVLLTGEPGIGRTTLLAELAADRPPGGLVLRCAPAEAERHLPFLGMIDLLADADDDTLFTDLSARERAVLRAALHRSPQSPQEAPHDQPYDDGTVLTLRVAVLKALTALCARAPVLLVVDDAQWLDRPTAETLAFAARRARRLPLSVIAAVRTPETGPAAEVRPAETLCPPPVVTLSVPPMSEREVAALLARHGREGGPGWGRPLLARLHAAAGGNPYVAVELARAVAEECRTAGQPPTGPLPVPAAVRRLLLDRLAPLGPRARRTLLAASAAALPHSLGLGGAPATLALLRRAGCDDAAADVHEAVRLGVLEPSATGLVRFAQPLMPRVVYEEAAPAGRRRVHAALAEAADDPVERAHHLASSAPGWDAVAAAALAEAAT